MLDLIPSLLAAQANKQAVIDKAQMIETPPITQQKSQLPSLTPVPSMAIPESISIQSLGVSPGSGVVQVASTVQTLPEQSKSGPTTSNASIAQSSQVVVSRTQNSSVPTAKLPTPAVTSSNASRSASQATTLQRSPLEQTKLPNNITKIDQSSSKKQSVIVNSEQSENQARGNHSSNPATPERANIRQLLREGQQSSKVGVIASSQVEHPGNQRPSDASSVRIDSGNQQQLLPINNSSVGAVPAASVSQQQQLVEQRLADIISKRKAARQSQKRDALVARAYSYATQRRFDRARKLLQDPAVPSDVRAQVLNNINHLEVASRSLGVTKLVEQHNRPGLKQSSSQANRLKPLARSAQRSFGASRSESQPSSRIVIQIPGEGQSNDSDLPLTRDTKNGPSVVSPVPQSLQAYNRDLPNPEDLRNGKILYPLPSPVPVTSKFGWRVHPITRTRRFHAGVDLGAAQGTPIFSSRRGRVVTADRMGGYGLAIVLEHDDGTQDTLYAHLSQIFVRPGEEVKPGMVIGRVGNTGRSTGPHLHYEARSMTDKGWVAIDPGPQLESAKVELVKARNTGNS